MKNLLLALLLFPVTFYAQVAMNGAGSYNENFDNLLNSGSVNDWFENSTIPNWYSQRTSTSTTYAASTGSGNFGGLYSYGASASNDRALGSIGSNNTSFGGSFAHGVLLQNSGTDVVNNINLTYTLEEWRNGGSNAAQTVTVWYKVSTSRDTLLNPGLANTGWTEITALAGSSPVSSLTAGALDGNASANRVTLSEVLAATVSAGSYILIRWSDIDHTGSDDGLAIDDVSITWGTCIPSYGTDIQTACDSLSWVDGNTYYSSNNTATYPFLNLSGCDSIVTLDLTLNYSSGSYLMENTCQFPYTATNGSTYQTAGIYTSNSIGTNGCPVIDTLEIIQTLTTYSTDIQSACDSATWIDGNTYTASNNSATYTLVNAAGCDSIISLDLTVNYSGSSYLLQEVCTFPFTSNGTTYNAAGVYTTTSVGANGCPVVDSVDVVQITPIAVFANETAIESGIIETATIGQSYQWIDCGSQANISGQTTNTYTPQSNGSYAVIVEFPGNCFSTSNCVLIDYLSIEESTAVNFQVYPNPSTGTIQISLPSNKPTEIVLSDMNGKIIYTKLLVDGMNTVSLPNLNKGAYFISVKTNDTIQQQKIIIE